MNYEVTVEGWRKVTKLTKFHYFENEKSLCKRWDLLFSGFLMADKFFNRKYKDKRFCFQCVKILSKGG